MKAKEQPIRSQIEPNFLHYECRKRSSNNDLTLAEAIEIPKALAAVA